MQNIRVHRYQSAPVAGFLGYIEPEDKSWTLWVDVDNRPTFLVDRATGYEGPILRE